MSTLKYEYHLKTWGGFYNEEYAKIHKKAPGDFWFNTFEERSKYVQELQHIEETLHAKHLAVTMSEGYNCRTETVLHRVILYKDVPYYSTCNLGVNYSFDAANYFLTYKWVPGFNDYPLGETFDYDAAYDAGEIAIHQEWITGAFSKES